MKTNPEKNRLIREVLMKNPRGLNILQIAEKTGINRMSAGRYLDVLAVQGFVDIQKVGNAKVYFLSKQIPVTTYMEYTSKHYCITDSSLHVVQLNKWIPKTVGMAEEDFIGRSLPGILEGVVLNIDECRAAMERALAGEVSVVLVEENFRGLHKFFEILHMPVQFPDGSHGMMAISQDVTDERKREIALREEAKLFQDLVEHIPDILFSTDAYGKNNYISPRIAEYGRAPDTLVGRPFVDLIVPEDRKSALAGFAAARKKGSATGIRFRITDGEGRAAWIEGSCMALMNAAGACTGINGVLRSVPKAAPASRKRNTVK
jgi:PAS domain S-box-containing protein